MVIIAVIQMTTKKQYNVTTSTPSTPSTPNMNFTNLQAMTTKHTKCLIYQLQKLSITNA